MNQNKIEKNIFLSRLLTRSGDQAWDFAVPLTLIALFLKQPQIAFWYFFLSKLGTFVFTPYVGRLIDKNKRTTTAKLGIGMQVSFLVLTTLIICMLYFYKIDTNTLNFAFVLSFIGLVISGVISNLGAVIMDIAIANDLVPEVIPLEDLPRVNSRLRQIDLFSEVASPILAGLLLLISTPDVAIMGFLLIALWNLLSFYPELYLLNKIFEVNPTLINKPVKVSASTQLSLFAKFKNGWVHFTQQKVALSIVSYSLLWLSVLSPHGVLLTAFLKGSYHLSELVIGLFRALGALFGLAATVAYPKVHKKLGLLKASRFFIFFQAAMVILAIICFIEGDGIWKYGFLGFILISRIGLYGFMLGEQGIRQIGIPEEVRGEINGFASALNSLATLFLFLLGAILSSSSDFPKLITISVVAVVLGAVLFGSWASSRHSIQSENR